MTGNRRLRQANADHASEAAPGGAYTELAVQLKSRLRRARAIQASARKSSDDGAMLASAGEFE
jgi:hypothetical protein